MIPSPAHDTAPAVLTAAQEQALARMIRVGRRARLLAQRHLAARLRRDLPPAVSARVAAAAVLAAVLPRLPLAPVALPAVVGPLLPRALAAAARARVLADLAARPGRPPRRRRGPRRLRRRQRAPRRRRRPALPVPWPPPRRPRAGVNAGEI